LHISICGELGAGCTELGHILSQKLGIDCVNSADLVKMLMINFGEGFGDFEGHVRSGEVDMDKMIGGKIEEMLMVGETIVEGRSAFMLLENKGTFKVFLVAPQTNRAEHIAKTRNITVKEALEAIQASDTERRHMVERLFKKDRLNPHNYDLVINTATRSHEETANLIAKIAQKKPSSK
jgi:cytidylate kinase